MTDEQVGTANFVRYNGKEKKWVHTEHVAEGAHLPTPWPSGRETHRRYSDVLPMFTMRSRWGSLYWGSPIR